jgi:hypothetical protein
MFSFGVIQSYSQVSVFKAQIDSLSKLYNKNVIGFSKTVVIRKESGPRESLIIFYEENGETEQLVVSHKLLSDSESEPILQLDSAAKKLVAKQIVMLNYSVYYDNTYIGTMNTFGYFTRCNPESSKKFMKKYIRDFVSNTQRLDKFLLLKFGKYYKGLL